MTQHDFPSAMAAEAAFYQAFESSDHDAMMAVWCSQDDIECIHPLGERLMGVAAVSDSWQKILSGSKQLRFQVSHARQITNEQLAVHVVYENITIDGREQPPVIATNVYRNNGNGWHMVLHHASPATDIEGKRQQENTGADETILH